MSVYKSLLERASQGNRYKIDLTKKNLIIGRKKFIKDGECCVDDNLIDEEDLKELGLDNMDSWDAVNKLYREFKYSVPSEHDKSNSYFKPLPYSDLSDGDLAYNKPRHLAQAMLEGYILVAILTNKLNWKNEEHWFYQDEEDKELILLKEWF